MGDAAKRSKLLAANRVRTPPPASTAEELQAFITGTGEKPKPVKLTIYATPELRTRLRVRGATTGTKLSAIVVEAIERLASEQGW